MHERMMPQRPLSKSLAGRHYAKFLTGLVTTERVHPPLFLNPKIIYAGIFIHSTHVTLYIPLKNCKI